MAIVKWDPFKDMVTIKDRMNRLFDEVFSKSNFYGDEDMADGLWSPCVDIYETEDSVVLKAELPEMDEKDIDINIKKNGPTNEGEREHENETKKENY